jgi:hypothetical protein
MSNVEREYALLDGEKRMSRRAPSTLAEVRQEAVVLDV